MFKTYSLMIIFVAISLSGCNNDSSDSGATVTPETKSKPLIMGHRGVAGYYPDHTLFGYKKAVELGADFVEPDLVMTKDGVLVCRHEPYIGGTTDVANHPEFAGLRKSMEVDGIMIANEWFVSDFTLAQLKTLRAVQPLTKERNPSYDRNPAYDGLFEIPTFEEMIVAVQDENKRLGKNAGIIPEIKHSTYHAQIFKKVYLLEDEALRILAKYGYTKKEDPAFIQSFEVENLKYLNQKTDLRLVQLIDYNGLNDDGTIKPGIKDVPYVMCAEKTGGFNLVN